MEQSRNLLLKKLLFVTGVFLLIANAIYGNDLYGHLKPEDIHNVLFTKEAQAALKVLLKALPPL